jgi:hypothetical protein
MNVGQLIEELRLHDPESLVEIGIEQPTRWDELPLLLRIASRDALVACDNPPGVIIRTRR